MSTSELHEMILGERLSRPRPGGDARFSLTVTHAGTEEGHFLLDFDCRVRGVIHLLLLDDCGVIRMKIDRRCRSGHNQVLLDLARFPAGIYQVDLLTADHIETCTLVR